MANSNEPDHGEELPMFQSGGFVKETGLVVVHERDDKTATLGTRPANRVGAKREQPL